MINVRVVVTGKHFSQCLMFAGNTEAFVCVSPYIAEVGLTSNIKFRGVVTGNHGTTTLSITTLFIRNFSIKGLKLHLA